MNTSNGAAEWYNNNAADFVRHLQDPRESVYHHLYEKPAMYGLLPDLSGRAVISLGCGSGDDSQYMLDQGARRVDGVDISDGMIAIAANAHPDCHFHVMNMTKLDFPDNCFDFAYSSLALHYLKTWDEALSEVFRVLQPGSSLLFSCNHPVATAMELTHEEGQLRKMELSRTVDREQGIAQVAGGYMTRRTVAGRRTTWHKPFGEMFAELRGAGFVEINMVEPQPLPEMQDVSPIDYALLLRIPRFIIFSASKPN